MNKQLTGFAELRDCGRSGFPGSKRAIFLSGLLWSLFLCSCGSSDTPNVSSEEGSTLHVVSASSPAELTRSVTELTSGSIGVFQTSTSDGYTLQSDKEYAYADGAWSATGEEIRLRTANALVFAYTPYDASLTDYTAVPLTSGLYDAASDLSYSPTLAGPVNASNRNVSFTMVHAYARITLNIRRGTYQGTGAVSGITLGGTGLYTSGTLNLSDGTYAGQVSGDVTLSPGITSTSTTTDTPVSFRLVPTESLPSGLTLSFVVDGYTLKASTTTYEKLEAGVNYQASVQINGQDVTPSIDTVDWEEVPYDKVIYTGL